MPRRRCVILQFPTDRARKPAPPPPKTARLHYDFNHWCVFAYVGGRRDGWWSFSGLDEAKAKIEHLVEEAYERLPASDAAVAAGGGS